MIAEEVVAEMLQPKEYHHAKAHSMKNVKLFYLRDCPFCKKAMRYIDELKAAHPEFRDIEIEMIEESEQPEVANKYDYHYVPTFYLNEIKAHEGGIYADEVEQILRKALNRESIGR